MPFAGYEDFDACVRANGDKDDPEAYCAAIKRQIEGPDALSDADKEAIRASDNFSNNLLADDPCWEGYTMVGTKPNGDPRCVPDDDVPDANLAAADDRCGEGMVEINGTCVPVEDVDAPASLLEQPRVMASASPLDTQPIERQELGDGKVKYASLKLISGGVWTDSASETPTLYDDRTFENTTPESGGRDGPPVNIAHDLHKNGPDAGEPHEASVAGYIDPDSLGTDGEALFGDVILNTEDAAGDFADENLKSALENNGTAGFSPSVELMPTELEDADHPRAEEYVAAAELTGLGLVRDPASKSVDLQHETRERAVALANGGGNDKALYLKDGGMSENRELDADEVRETLDMFGFDGLDEMTDEEVMDMAEDLHSDLMEQVQAEDGEEDEEDEEEQEMAEHDDEEEEDEEDKDMADDEMEALMDTVSTLESRLEDLEDKMASVASESELEDAKSELSAVKEEKQELADRVKTLEDQPKEGKTLADGREDEDSIDWSDADDGVQYDPATGSMSR